MPNKLYHKGSLGTTKNGSNNIRRLIGVIISLVLLTSVYAQKRDWKSGIELGTGLSFTGYNANLAYTGTFGENVVYAGPKVVYSDANTLFDTPWGFQLGYRRLFAVSEKLMALATLDYQLVFFEYEGLTTNELNAIHEVHFSYGLQYFLTEQWSIGNTIGGGGYIERLVDPFDGRVDVFTGYSAHVRIFITYHF